MKLFKFDPEKLDFVESRSSFILFLKKVLRIILISILLAVLYYIILSIFVMTDEERRMVREKEAIRKEYGQLREKLSVLESSVNNMTERDEALYMDLFNTTPLSVSADMDANAYLDYPDGVFNKELVYYVSENLPGTVSVADSIDRLLYDISGGLDSIDVRNIPSILPVSNFSVRQTGASLGMKMHPFYKTLQYHNGIDIVTSVGTDVLATADGVVSEVAQSKKGFGNRITVDHGNGYMTTYSHLKDILVRKGTVVKRGMKIARVGTSGTTFAPHLHYEVLLNGSYQEPINYFFCNLSPELYLEMIKISTNTGQSLE